MNKGVGEKQPWLRNGFVEGNGVNTRCIVHPMTFQDAQDVLIQKRGSTHPRKAKSFGRKVVSIWNAQSQDVLVVR